MEKKVLMITFIVIFILIICIIFNKKNNKILGVLNKDLKYLKKIFILSILLIPNIVFSKEKIEFYKCIDGDTAKFIINKEEVKVRFLGIDSPELEKNNQPAEEYSNEALNYTCRKLKNANKIEFEYEPKSDKYDRYDRLLAYVFVDDKLLNELIVKNGYANVKYINKNYKYYDLLVQAEEKAKVNKKGMYSESKEISKEDLFENIKKIITKYTKKIYSSILKEILK